MLKKDCKQDVLGFQFWNRKPSGFAGMDQPKAGGAGRVRGRGQCSLASTHSAYRYLLARISARRCAR